MRIFDLLPDGKESVNILCLGAHCDDIEIGCGGTMLQFLQSNSNISMTWVVFCSDDERSREAARSFDRFSQNALHNKIVIHHFRDGFLPWLGLEVKEAFEEMKAWADPDVIFTHYREDLHQDHRLISDLTWNTFRNHLILEYEIMKYDGDIGRTNTYMPIDEENCRKKIDLIMDSYRSQKSKKWFTDDLFWALPRIRGMEINAPSRYAEAFYSRKVVIA